MQDHLRILKKNLEKYQKENPNHLVFFFDESRFGTHSKLGHGWFPKGKRTTVKVKLGFQNFYLYSAVNPDSGEDFTLISPWVNTPSMNIFLDQLSKYLKDKKALVVMDCAGWHRSKTLVVPENIKIVYLPPYSPELNPVERLWGYIKQHTIKNRVYETLEDLEQAVSEFLISLTPNLVSSICAANYV